MSDQNYEAIVPAAQERIEFYRHDVVAVLLPDGRIGVVLRWLCDALQLDAKAQVRRIRRTKAIAEDLLSVRVSTEGGQQTMPALALRSLPFWLAGIDTSRVGPELEPTILAYQREVVDVLYRHFSERRLALTPPPNLVTDQSIHQPEAPAEGAPLDAWMTYHQEMMAWLQWQRDIQAWRQGVGQWQGEVESRLESVEEMTRLVPEILERLGPQTLSPEHQRTVQASAKRLHELTGRSYSAIYDALRQDFQVGTYIEIPEVRWPDVAAWLKQQIARVAGR